MEMPQELEVWYVLPALRREFSRFMLAEGIKQREIAKKLGIAESAVSHYIKAKRANTLKFNNSLKEEIRKSVKRLLENNSSVMEEMQLMIVKVRKSGMLCKLHKNHVKSCEVCKK